jgi:hypothetical protein
MDRFPFPFVREFIDRNGGQAAFEGLTTDLNLQHGDTKGCECVCGFACHLFTATEQSGAVGNAA